MPLSVQNKIIYCKKYEIVLYYLCFKEFTMDQKLAERIHKLNFLASEMDSIYHQASQKLGVSDSEMCILYTIQDQGENCLLSDVYKQSGINKQTINSAIRKMENDELLFLENVDGKRKRIVLTGKGRSYMQKTAGVLFEAESRAFGSWPEEEMDKYILLMAGFVEALRRETENI